MARRLLPPFATVLLVSLLPLSAFAQQQTQPAPAPAPQTRGVDKGIEFGAFLQGMTADPVLNFFYATHQPVTGTTFGGYFLKRAPDGSRLMLDIAYTSTSPSDGVWLATGKQTSSNEWTEFRNFRVYSADLVYGHEWTSGGFFGWNVGGGIGVAYYTGTINSFGTCGPTTVNPQCGGSTNYTVKDTNSAPDNKLKGLPPVVPTLIFRTGPSFNFADFGALYIEGGLQDGLFLGARFGIQL